MQLASATIHEAAAASVYSYVCLCSCLSVNELLCDVVAPLLVVVLVRVSFPISVRGVRIQAGGSSVRYARGCHNA
jgi:hypothetical protein